VYKRSFKSIDNNDDEGRETRERFFRKTYFTIDTVYFLQKIIQRIWNLSVMLMTKERGERDSSIKLPITIDTVYFIQKII